MLKTKGYIYILGASYENVLLQFVLGVHDRCEVLCGEELERVKPQALKFQLWVPPPPFQNRSWPSPSPVLVYAYVGLAFCQFHLPQPLLPGPVGAGQGATAPIALLGNSMRASFLCHWMQCTHLALHRHEMK